MPEGQGMKVIIPPNITDVWIRLEILLGLKLSGPTDTLTEASNLVGQKFWNDEKQNDQESRIAVNNMNLQKRNNQVYPQSK